MRALQLVVPGSPLEERDIDLGSPSPHEVLVDVAAAGICRSDVHYRAGFPEVGPLPLTLGHEVAGVVAAVGESVTEFEPGARVCVHYQVGCGSCRHCSQGFEQFCLQGEMIGNSRPGGYAEQIMIPERNVAIVPPSVSLEHAAVMMCSSATSLHALRKGRLRRGQRVAVFGVGGLGMSAIQLAFIEGAETVFAIDTNPQKLEMAASMGAVALPATDHPVDQIRQAGGVDVALDLVGSARVMEQCLHALAPMGRAVAVGLTPDTFSVGPYTDLVSGESEVIGASDHLMTEIVELLDLAAAGRLSLDGIVDNEVPLAASPVNEAMDQLEAFGGAVRTVICP